MVDNQAKRPAKRLRFLAIPMEINADGDIFEREGCVVGFRAENQLLINFFVPENRSVFKRGNLLALDFDSIDGIRRVQRKFHLLRTDDADGHHRLRMLIFLRDFLCRFRINGAFLQNFRCFRGRQPLEIFLSRRDDEAGHVERTRTDEHLTVALGKIAVGTMLATRKNDGNRRVALAPRHDVHHRLFFS